jgi:hypothetical protein
MKNIAILLRAFPKVFPLGLVGEILVCIGIDEKPRRNFALILSRVVKAKLPSGTTLSKLSTRITVPF